LFSKCLSIALPLPPFAPAIAHFCLISSKCNILFFNEIEKNISLFLLKRSNSNKKLNSDSLQLRSYLNTVVQNIPIGKYTAKIKRIASCAMNSIHGQTSALIQA